jgi:hypothetical protein
LPLGVKGTEVTEILKQSVAIFRCQRLIEFLL